MHNELYLNLVKKGAIGEKKGPQAIYEIIRPFWVSGKSPVVWFSDYGWVDANTVGWESAKNGRPWKMFNSAEIKIDTNAGNSLSDAASIIIITKSESMGKIKTPHTKNIANDVLNDNFLTLETIKHPSGAELTVLVKAQK